MKIEELHRKAGREEIDYQFLISQLQHYSRPREKISAWLKSGELIRVKKGLYVFGKYVSTEQYSPEILANLIYGPSAISLSYALSYYGLIPERVMTVTSITNKRNKYFSTPVGEFSYFYLNPNKYPVGLQLAFTSKKDTFFIATPEKALCDQIHIIDKKILIRNVNDMESYLFQDLRIDPQEILKIKITRLREISKIYKDQRIEILIRFIERLK